VLLLLCGGGLAYGGFYFIKTAVGRHFWDARRIKLPILASLPINLPGAVHPHAGVARAQRRGRSSKCSRSFADRRQRGHGAGRIKTAAIDIERGESISSALGKHPIFPSMIIRMVTAGEPDRGRSIICWSASPTSWTRRSRPRSPG